MARYRDEPESLLPTALYTLVDLTDAELKDCERECETGCIDTGSEQGICVRSAPQARFVGQPLRAAFDYHIDLAAQKTFEPFYFLAVVEKDWQTKGVILVTLDDDEGDCNVDSFRIKAVDSGLTVVNLQITNMDWEEAKDSDEFRPDDGDDDEDDENDDVKSDEDKMENEIDNNDGPPALTKNVPLGYYIPIYIHSSLSEEQIITDLEPGLQYKSPENLACRVQAKLTPASSSSDTTPTQDLIRQAAILHPQRCVKNRYLHKTHILVIDTANPEENGMLMVKLPSKAEEEIALATPPHIRIPYSCHDGLQTRFLILANGDASWPSESIRSQPVFIVFQYNTSGKFLGFCEALIDSGATKRKPGEERLIFAPEVFMSPGNGLKNITWNYAEAVRRFPWFCREKRFVEGLDKRFFICVDGDEVEETGLRLVRRDWDGEVWGRTREELIRLPWDGVRKVRVPVKEALVVLERGRKGETDGMSESLKEFFL
jgi:hypothetical protein